MDSYLMDSYQKDNSHLDSFPMDHFLLTSFQMDRFLMDRLRLKQSLPNQRIMFVLFAHKHVKTCIEVDYEGETLSALVDTGSDVSIAGDDIARRFGWIIHEHPAKFIKMANDEEMIIHGAAKIPLHVGRRSVNSEILVTPDLNGLIIGIDWLEKQGQFIWNFRDGQIKFDNGEWLELQREDASRRIRRVYVSEDTLIPASGQAEVDVRIKHRTLTDKPYLGFVENSEVPSLTHSLQCTKPDSGAVLGH